MLEDFHFLRPWWLLALLPAALMLYLLIRNKFKYGDWTQVCDAELLPFILQEKPVQTHTTGWIAAGLATLLCILALAGPTWERLPSPAFRNDSALVIALDLSKSMDATDTKPSRISRARYKISDILKLRKDGQTALMVYSGDAFTVTPLTTDTATINSQLEALTTDIMPSPGSNTSVAMEKAVDLLRQAGLTQGHILLVTDGADGGSVAEAGSLLGDYRLSVLALGSPDGAPIPLPGGGFLKDDSGNIVVAKLDAAELSELTANGHGLFQRATANDDDIERLSNVFNQVTNADNTGLSDSLLQNWDEKGPWLMLLILPWAALQFRKGLLVLVFILLLPFPKPATAYDWQSLWQSPDQRAQQAFQQQDYQEAAEQFNNSNWRAAAQYKAGQYQEAAETLKNAQSADEHYNRGNALAKAGELPAAIDAYQQAIKLEPNHADAKYNKALLEKQLQEQQQNKQSSDSDKSEQQQQSKDQASEQGDQQNQQQSAENPNQWQDHDSTPQKPDDSKAADKSEQKQDKQPQPEQDVDRPEDARRSQNSKPEPTSPSTQDAQPAAEQDEIKRANEQLLKRIPDEPTGLLKRKFKYQYGQRDPPPHSGPNW